LSATELQVGSVNLPSKKLVDGRGAGKNDGLTLDLDGTLTKTNKVSTDTFGDVSWIIILMNV